MRRGGYQIPQSNFPPQNFQRPQFNPHLPHPPPGTPTGPRMNIDPLAAGLPAKPNYQAYHSGPKIASVPGESLPSTSELTAIAPTIGPQGFIQQSSSVGTISSEPKLRDLKAEAIAFVPTHVKRKKVAKMVGAGSIATVNAAKAVEGEREEGEKEEKVSLMDSLRAAGVGKASGSGAGRGGEGKEDYNRFLKEMGDIL